MSQTVRLSSTKNRLYSFDFLRVLCAIGIIVFHFSCELDKTVDNKVLYFYANGSWGNTIVNVFFLISGAMLYYNNSEIKSLKTFYYKRIKSIFPMFYIAFILFYLLSAIKSKNVFLVVIL
jgi:peptidoglycan/LPS O-acetylase OafA/YrhL